MRVLTLGLTPETAEATRLSLVDRGASWERKALAGLEELGREMRIGESTVVVAGHTLSGIPPMEAMRLVNSQGPKAQLIAVVETDEDARLLVEAGALDAFTTDQIWRLPIALRHAREAGNRLRSARKLRGMEVLTQAVKELSMARSMEGIVEIVRKAARQLSEADGATFVLRDGDKCHYVEEDAIAPLWRGLKFPMSNCVSGWAMINKKAAVIPDIYDDPRVPVDAYRPTFVKSMVMMPIRTGDPIGAIGTYWSYSRRITPEDIAMIQALADSTALAVENVQFVDGLERQVKERTASLEGVNKELEAFSYSVSHDLRSPLAVIKGYSDLLLDDGRPASIGESEKRMVQDMRVSAERMQALIDDMLRLSQVSRREVQLRPVDLSAMAREILDGLAAGQPKRKVEVKVEDDLIALGDAGLLRIALENLLSNAWKYSSKRDKALIEVGALVMPGGATAFYVRDNGAGFDMSKAGHLFEPFQRLHTNREFPGTGIGLATVNRVMQKHGGKVWAESEKDRGSTFSFSLPPTPAVAPVSTRSAAAIA